LLAFAFLPQTPRPSEPDDEPRPYVYYDYLENGELRGGRVPIDASNPLHADTGELHLGVASPVTTLLSNGPPANRIDLVFVGDGYTAAQLGVYSSDVDAVWPVLLAEPPLAAYASYFNVHRVDVTSLESGVDNDPTQGILRSTAMDMGYWCSGIQRLLCVNVSKANAQANSAPGKDSVLALANSGTYGGAGYTNLGTLAGHNGSAIEIALHEFGHSFASLADEYDYGGPATYPDPEPSEQNVTIYDEAELLALKKKWFRWLDLANVGTFEGADYSRFGIYRPTFNSKMRNLGRPFEEVNTERIVRNVYRYVHPLDDATPEGAYPLDATFFVDPLDPVTHALDIQWRLDGVKIPGATGTSFDAGSLGLHLGSYVLSVEVVDNTPLVRSFSIRASFMTEGRTWVLTDGKKVRPHGGSGPVLTLTGAPAGGGFEFELDSPAGASRAGALPLLFLDPAPSAGPRRAPVSGPGDGRFASLVGSPWSGPGQPVRLHLSLPEDLTLLERTFFARAALFDRGAPPGRRLVWSNALEFAPGR